MRSMWKGSISFGLVNIPVAMYSASQAKELSFVLLHKKDFSEIRYARMCKAEEKEVPWEDIVKGYEYEKGEFVVLDDKDFDKVGLKKSKTIEIINFVNEDEIDSVYYVKPLFLEPDKNGQKAYGLLRDALKKSKKVGLAKYILRNHEHLAVVKCHEDILILNELRFQSELISPKELAIPETKANPKELAIAMQLIDHLTVPFKPAKYKDTYVEEVKALIKQKAKGKPIHPTEEKAPRPSKIHDIMSLLQESLEKKPQEKKEKKPKRKTA